MLDFNKALGSYEPHIQGTRNLLDMALASPHEPHFVFTSSVSAAFSWDRSRGPVPEKLTELNGGVKGSIGYGQSKFVAEQVRARCSKNKKRQLDVVVPDHLQEWVECLRCENWTGVWRTAEGRLGD